MTIVHSFCVGVKTLMVPLPRNESLVIIKTQKELRMYILANTIRVVVKVQNVLKFEGVTRGFDQDEELSFNSQLFDLMLLMDGDTIMAIICHSSCHRVQWLF
jgi:hypothetical protein